MSSQRVELPIVAFSVRVYQTLLIAYPTKFQQKYGSDMVDVFRSCCLRAVRQGAKNGMVRLWAVTLLDLIQSVISEHTQKEVQVKKEMKPEDVRLAGWALIWAAVAFLLGTVLLLLISTVLPGMGGPAFGGISFVLLVFLCMPLLMVGLSAVRNQYGEKVGGFGKNILSIGVILGPLTSLLGFFIGIATGEERLWIMVFGGPAVILTCLALFGIVALYKKPLPRWNMAPVLAGAGYPILHLFASINSITNAWEGVADAPMFMIVINILFIIQGIALAALGYILKSEVPEEIPAPA